MRLPSRVVTLLAVAALPLALSACSSGSSSGTGASAHPAKEKNPNAGLLTGTQLKKALAPASALPAAFTHEADGTSDSGNQFLAPSSRNTAKPDCTRLEGTSWIQVSGFKGGVSFAQDDYVNQDKTEELAQEIDQFQGTTAKTVMNELRSAATGCATFTDTDAHAKVKVTGRSTAGLGDEAYTMTLTSGAWENGTTLIAARSGNAVVTVLSTAGSDNGAATAKKLTTEVLGSLKGKTAA
ncbi:hypothetical protein J2Z21_006507 [Streptomyces griseochromogenes]|uniref:PknH-like extracellular domain-containing protein n=1 Tax=Streptomyces griseochromogenes TaxID=68214 RepID=A0A1B1B9R8_9ACTN|nr:hypothetical protein [Streptomyces griseochromogenes]ANP55531.1 hypothetical protein AVL59_43320 [Streptomyces griseochromogenes]MBP2053514.1 hypothetical protein [Streptomyces griseochromogenes]